MDHTNGTPAPLAGGNRGSNNRALGCHDNARKPLDFQRINDVALARLPDGKRQGHEWVARNPRRTDTHARYVLRSKVRFPEAHTDKSTDGVTV